MIEQIKTYLVTCDGRLSDWFGERELHWSCPSKVTVQSTSKSEALRDLPNGWRTQYHGSYSSIYCPQTHVHEKSERA